MSKEVVQVQVRAVLPTSQGSAVFIGNAEKVFVIYVERGLGDAILMFMNRTPKQRPLSHDLMGMMLKALGAKVERVVISGVAEGIYFARLILSAENEVMERKIVELDARPSDCLALAVGHEAPVYVARTVWDAADDMTAILAKMQEEGA